MISGDLLFMGIGVAFAVLLLPTLTNPETAVSRKTSVPSGVLLLLLAANFYRTGFVLAFVGNLSTAAAWFLIAAFRPEARADG